MPTVVFVDHHGSALRVESPANRNLMQVARDHAVPGIHGDCGGSCSCATCHAYIDEPWASQLVPPDEGESFMLEGVPERRPSSRLCCQVRLTEALDGIVVTLPEEQA
jgi:2Fe-2S ferredoxin